MAELLRENLVLRKGGDVEYGRDMWVASDMLCSHFFGQSLPSRFNSRTAINLGTVVIYFFSDNKIQMVIVSVLSLSLTLGF